MNPLKYLLSKASKKSIDADSAAFLKGVLDNELATLEMQSAAKAEAGPSVILTPAVPLPACDAVGWFGGAPSLPNEVEWPEVAGTPLCFVAQINLAQLPQNIWSGVGPRHGYFSFFVHPTDVKAKVLHVDGALSKRQGPSPVSSNWFRNHYDKRPPVSEYFPQWPVQLIGNVGQLPEPAGWRKGQAPGFPKPFKDEKLDLRNPAHQPYDERTLDALVEILDKVLESRLISIARLLETKKLKDDVAAALSNLQVDVQSAHQSYSEIKEDMSPYRQAYDRDALAPHLHALNGLQSGSTTYHRDDEEGYAEIQVSKGKLIHQALGFLQILERHAKYTYLESPEKLTPEAKKRFETIWAFDAIHERGGMSHPPKGFIYTAHGPESPNEVLLELPTSDLLGWIWGDMYSVVLTVARNDLANGTLDNVSVDITN